MKLFLFLVKKTKTMYRIFRGQCIGCGDKKHNPMRLCVFCYAGQHAIYEVTGIEVDVVR